MIDMSMKIYVANDYEGNPVAVLLADDPDKAEVAFTALQVKHYSTEVIDPNEKNIGVHGVAFLFGSREVEVTRGMKKKVTRVLKRGL